MFELSKYNWGKFEKCEKRYSSWYDTKIFNFGTGCPEIYFGADVVSRIGNFGKTNVQVAGQLASDQAFLLHRMWFHTMAGKLVTFKTKDLLEQMIITFYVGDKPSVLATGKQAILGFSNKGYELGVLLPVPARANSYILIQSPEKANKELPIRVGFDGFQVRTHA